MIVWPCLGVDLQPATSGCPPAVGQCLDRARLPLLFLKILFLLPSTFCASGQLLLVGSSTYPPCPEFT
jgi:hypothetical protein